MTKKANQEKIPAEIKYKHGGRKVEIEVVWKKPSEVFSAWSEDVDYLSHALDVFNGDLQLVDFKRLKDFAQNVKTVSGLSLTKEDPLAPHYIRDGSLSINHKNLAGIKLRVFNEYFTLDEASYFETMKKLSKLASSIADLNPAYARVSHIQNAYKLCDMVRELGEASEFEG